jgi:hypothetical protein
MQSGSDVDANGEGVKVPCALLRVYLATRFAARTCSVGPVFLSFYLFLLAAYCLQQFAALCQRNSAEIGTPNAFANFSTLSTETLRACRST